MTVEQAIMNYIIGATSIILVVLLYIGYTVFRLKKIIRNQIEHENKPNYQGY